MRPPVDFSLPLSVEDAHRLITALDAYVIRWRHHYEEDGGRTHTPEEWEAVRTQTGELLWRLEELAVLPGQILEHSDNAVRPQDDDGEDGGTGVREPRRPGPPPPTATYG